MNQNIKVKAPEIADVIQREKNSILGGLVIIINNYFDSRQSAASAVACDILNNCNNAVNLSNYLLNYHTYCTDDCSGKKRYESSFAN